jgi:hypothetical protein
MLECQFGRRHSNIMKTPYYSAKDLEALLSKQKVATMGELKAALKTEVDITVFRKLKQLESITSYSHRGRYYSLKRLARFDENGIWAVEGIRFSDRVRLSPRLSRSRRIARRVVTLRNSRICFR